MRKFSPGELSDIFKVTSLIREPGTLNLEPVILTSVPTGLKVSSKDFLEFSESFRGVIETKTIFRGLMVG